MSLDEFISKYNGKYVDIDGAYGAQCVDLMRQYCKEVLGLDPYILPRADYAKNIYKKSTSSDAFEKIANTPSGVPSRGDLIFWDFRLPVTGIAGHVAIYAEGDVKRFIAFGQNYGKPNYSRYQNYDYRGILGWLHPKK